MDRDFSLCHDVESIKFDRNYRRSRRLGWTSPSDHFLGPRSGGAANYTEAGGVEVTPKPLYLRSEYSTRFTVAVLRLMQVYCQSFKTIPPLPPICCGIGNEAVVKEVF
ncbi:uncharacterized protein LOC112590214 [Harpegnathos saltator]|uniref:uncharacterized protein LOC112590214 n=1 Tax=Harpegnathos saltator TaxID=610380 RepID=UPI000DBED2C4|nr:uncharacterized protein LOC112590214 [Harpegnathos saltator]